jgi:hypothetical protein
MMAVFVAVILMAVALPVQAGDNWSDGGHRMVIHRNFSWQFTLANPVLQNGKVGAELFSVGFTPLRLGILRPLYVSVGYTAGPGDQEQSILASASLLLRIKDMDNGKFEMNWRFGYGRDLLHHRNAFVTGLTMGFK